MREHVPPELDGCRAVGLLDWLRMYRYDPGQAFRWHRDGRERTERGVTRLSLLVYLNADCAGGETVFSVPGAPEVWVTPETGMALVFLHERRHAGEPVRSGRKYLLRTDVVYAGQP